MADPAHFPLEGGCDCRRVRYRLESAPLFVHCCHCRWCQRESGASFALNAMIEADRVSLLGEEPELVDTPSESGQGQLIARCRHCRIAVWSHYGAAGPLVRFVRVGTLDRPDALPPDIHIFTASKQPWVILAPGTPAVPEYYDREAYWPAASLARREALLPAIRAWQASRRDPPTSAGSGG
ncbi:MAG: GFA family protein [Burkholderiales bacterium]